jgi:hypothetical protein
MSTFSSQLQWRTLLDHRAYITTPASTSVTFAWLRYVSDATPQGLFIVLGQGMCDEIIAP